MRASFISLYAFNEGGVFFLGDKISNMKVVVLIDVHYRRQKDNNISDCSSCVMSHWTGILETKVSLDVNLIVFLATKMPPQLIGPCHL